MNIIYRNILKYQTKFLILGVWILLFAFINSAEARDLRASLAYLPSLAESPEKGIFVDLVKAMSEAYSEGKIQIKVYPFKRSVDNVISGKADFHIPILVNPVIPEEKLPYSYSTITLRKVIFILYANKSNQGINPQNLRHSKYKLETYRGFINYFDFPVAPSDSIEISLKKVDLGRIDACLFAMPETDAILKKLKLKNIRRWYYHKFDAKFLLPKGEKKQEIDQMLAHLLQKLRETGKYQKIIAPIGEDPSFKAW